MKIEMTKGLKFAPNCRTTLTLEKADIIEVGENGLTKDNLARLVELDVAREVSVDEVAAAREPEKVVDFREITDKTELEAFARETYGVELDRRKSIEKMIATLEKAIANEGE
jgi:hypothetical protein